ncbi:MAG TPA: HipA domain-containing protein [Mycobacteriales bacterium]|nr:HipA domain-containing protein [Mycobacteriales bacterium]
MATPVPPRQLYAWVWLPGATEPVVAGVLTRTEAVYDTHPIITFTYARSYRERDNAISLFTPELPLQGGTFDPTRPGETLGVLTATSTLTVGPSWTREQQPLPMHSCLRDAAPDAWGRRVINLRLGGDRSQEFDELTYLRQSGSDRIGALDFQDSPTEYIPRGDTADLKYLLRAAELLEAGEPIPPDLAAAAARGTSIGGARPKALLSDGSRSLIAKFPSSTDTRPVVKAEAAAMLLAARVGIDVANVEVHLVDKRDVLLVERFDRGADGTRRGMVSALTVMGENEIGSRHSSYAAIAESIRTGPWSSISATLTELFRRMVFNVCIGNTDDHLRNHATFWDGHRLTLTPAYDLEPVQRNTSVASHAIGLTRTEHHSQLRYCVDAAPEFHIDRVGAQAIIDQVVSTIQRDWNDVCDEARLTKAERDTLFGREFLNAYIFQDEP